MSTNQILVIPQSGGGGGGGGLTSFNGRTTPAAVPTAGDYDAFYYTKALSDARYTLGLTPTAVQTSNFTAAINTLIPVDTTYGNITALLPSAPADGSRILIKQIIKGGSYVLTVNTQGADMFNRVGGGTSATINVTGEAMTFKYQASTGIWFVESNDIPLTQLDTRYLNKVGTLFADDFSTNTIANYTTVTGGTFSISGGRMSVSGGVNDVARFARYSLCKLNSDNLTIKINQTVGEIDKRGIKYKIGNTFFLRFGLNTATSSASFIEIEDAFSFIANSPVGGSVGNSGFMDCQLNDNIEIILTINGFSAVITCYNQRSGVTLTAPIKRINYNTGFFDIVSVEGLNYVNDFSVVDNNISNITECYLGDSITAGTNGGLVTVKDNWVYQVQQAFDGVIKLAGAGDTVDTSAAYLTMISKYKLKRVTIFLGANDIVNLATLQTNYAALITALQGLGISVTIFTMLDNGSYLANTATFNAWLKTTYGGTNRIIDVNKVVDMSSTQYSPDYLHPNGVACKDIARYVINKTSDYLSNKLKYIETTDVVSDAIRIQDPFEGLQQASPDALTTTTNVINIPGKVGFRNMGYAMISSTGTETKEIIYYGGSTPTQLTNIKRGMFGTTAITVTAGQLVVAMVTSYIGSSDTVAPRFMQVGRQFSWNSIPFNNPFLSYSFELAGGSMEVRNTTGTGTIALKKATATDTFFFNFTALSGGTTYFLGHTNDNLLCFGSAFIGLFINSSSNLSIGTKVVTFRLTNATSDINAKFLIDPAASVTAGKAYAYDVTYGFVFTQANGTRRIASGAFNLINQVTTAGSEAADMGVYTQSAGGAMALRASFGLYGLQFPTIGQGIQIKEGTNARMGIATLVSGTATITNTSITANTRIFLTAQETGAITGILRVTARVNGTSFTIGTGLPGDTAVIAWELKEGI